MTEAEKERAAIVRWMHNEAAELLILSRDERYSHPLRAHIESNAAWLDSLANDIERAEHLKEGR